MQNAMQTFVQNIMQMQNCEKIYKILFIMTKLQRFVLNQRISEKIQLKDYANKAIINASGCIDMA